jgi:hypothetical protein
MPPLDNEPAAPASQDTPPAPTPTQPAPEGTPADVDYRQRYDNLRPQFDRTAQEAAALRAEMERVTSDADYQRQLMASWGYELEDPATATDPGAELRDQIADQLAELQEWKNTLTTEQQEAAQLQQITASVDEQFRAVGSGSTPLDDATKEWITTRALNMDPREDGMPDIAGAHKAFTDWEQGRMKAWGQTKRAPHIAADGTAGTNAPDLDKMNPTELAEWMAEEAIARMHT